jgi:hypothetical protein
VKGQAVSQSDKDFQRELRRRDKEFQMEMKGISSDMDVPSDINHGLISIILFVLTIGVYGFGMFQAINTISCLPFAMDGAAAIGGLRISSTIMAGSIVLLVAALAAAGMSIASGNGKIMGLIVIVLTILPILYLIFNIWFGTPFDAFNMAAGKGASDLSDLAAKCK